MSTQLANSLWTACTSSLELDRWMLGELSLPDAERVRAHVESCERCAPVVAAMRAQREEALPPLRMNPPLKLVSSAPEEPRVLASRTRGPRWWPRIAAAGAGMAAAALALIALQPPPAERTKGAGGFSIAMYVQHGEEVRRAGPDERVQGGDAIRFSVTSAASGYTAILSLDATGAASVYFPQEARAAALGAGADVALPISTRLDATVGEEKIFGLFCNSPIELAPVRESLAHGSLELPRGCQISRLNFVKH